MRRTVIYDGGTFEITARELLFSVIIVLVMLTTGFFIGEKISSSADERNQEYEQAAKIDGDKELFGYGMRTDIGNAFVYGTLKTVDPVSLPEIDGEYAYIRKVKEKYTIELIPEIKYIGHEGTEEAKLWEILTKNMTAVQK